MYGGGTQNEQHLKTTQRQLFTVFHGSEIVTGKNSDSRFKMYKSTYLFKCSRTECFIIDVTSCGSLEYK